MLTLYNKEHIKLKFLKTRKEYSIKSTLLTGDRKLSFLLPKHEYIETEMYVRAQGQEYVVKSISPSSTSWLKIECDLNVEELEGKPLDTFETVEKTIKECLDFAFVGTGWIVGSSTVTKRRTIKKTATTVWSILQDARKTYHVEFEIDSIKKIIHIHERIGGDKGAYFIDGLNIQTLTKQVSSYDLYTQIRPRGKDNLSISSVNGGSEIISDFSFSSKEKLFLWTDQRYTNAQSLMNDALLKLREMSKPLVALSLDVIDLSKVDKRYAILDYALGDTIQIISKEEKINEKTRIVSLVEYPDEPLRNKIEIANSLLKFEDLQEEFQEASKTVSNITSDDGTVDGSTINGMKSDQISDFSVKVAQVINLSAMNATIQNLISDKASVQELNAVNAKVGTLEATSISTTQFHTKVAEIENAVILKASIVDLSAASAKISILEANVGTIGTLISGSVSAGSTQTIVLNAKNTTIEHALIKSAMIDSLVASKITAGIIDASSIHFKSKTGNMDIYDNTISIRDATRVRVQIGKDASNDYNMYVWDNTGKLMFDATGLKADGIKGKIIRDDMVSDSANINGSKLNIASVVTGINNGTSSIKSSQILFDPTGQSLNVAFNSLSTKLDDIDIGERNLYKLTRNFRDTTSFILGLGSGSSGYIEASNGAMIIDKIAQGAYFYLVKTLCTIPRYEAGKQYTLTLRLKSNFNGAIMNASIRYGNGLECAGVFGDFKCTTEYQTISKTMTAIEGKSIELYLSFNAVTKYYIEWIKITEGNMSSDWSPAPEEVEDRVVALSTSLSVEQGKISGLISESTQIKGDVSSLNTKYTSIEATVKGLDVKVGEQTTSLSTVTNTVSANKANWDKAGNALATAESAKNSIDGLKIGGRNLLKFSNISVSNLALWAKSLVIASVVKEDSFDCFKIIPNEVTARDKGMSGNFEVVTDNILSPNQTYCYSFWCKTNVTQAVSNSSIMHFQTVAGTIVHNVKNIKYHVSTIKANEWTRLCCTFEVTTQCYFKPFLWYLNTNQIYFFYGFKIEQGNMPTDWSPAPEDTENLITTEIKTVTDKQASFDVTLDGIKGRVSSTESKVTTVTETVNGLQVGGRNLLLNSGNAITNAAYAMKTFLLGNEKPKAGDTCTITIKGILGLGKKDFAIFNSDGYVQLASFKPSDFVNEIASKSFKWATNTSDGQHPASNQSIVVYVRESSVVVNSTISWIRLDFGNKAPQIWTPAPEDVDASMTDIKSTIDGIQVGGRNLLIGTKDFTVGKASGAFNGTYLGFRVLHGKKEDTVGYLELCGYNSAIDVKPNKEYTMSFYAKGTGNIYSFFWPSVVSKGKSSQGKTTAFSDGSIITTLSDKWTRYWITWTTKSDVSGLKNVVPARLQVSPAECYICGIMFEESNKCSDWTPAPEDVETRITTEIKMVTDKQASLDVTLNGISGRVSSTESRVATVSESLNILQVGGTNQIKHSDFYITQTGIQHISITNDVYDLAVLIDKYITLSIEVSGSGVNPIVGREQRYGAHLALSWKNKSGSVKETYPLVCFATKDMEQKRLSGKVKIIKEEGYELVSFRIATQIWVTGNVKVGRPKLEIGTMATDWSPAPQDIDSRITTEIKTVTDKQALLDVTLNGITGRVSNTETNVTSITNSFNNLHIGSSNIFKSSGQFKDIAGLNKNWSDGGGGISVVSGVQYLGHNTIQTNVRQGIYGVWYKLEAGVEYTYAVMMRSTKAFTGSTGYPLHYWTGIDNVQSGSSTVTGRDDSYSTPNTWKLIYLTFKLVGNANSFKPFIYAATNDFGTWNIAFMTLTKGNKPLIDWSPAPEEVTTSITETTKKIADLILETDKFKVEVSETFTTKDTLKGYSTTTQMNSAITAKTDLIKLEVAKKTDKESIIASINLTPEAIKISANKLQLTGAVTISMLENSLKNTINTAKDDSYKAFIMARAMAQGRMLFTDPTFLRGYNGIAAYNNATNGNVSVARAGRHSAIADCPSPYYIEVQSKGVANPGWGGFHFGNQSSANHTYVYKIVAKIPSDRWISWAANASGDGSSMMWLTSQDGTDKFEEYICIAKAGASGTFSSIGFFYLQGGSAAKTWWLGYATCWDLNTEPLENEWTQGTTKINGGYIQTGTITADHISSNTLYGTTIVGGSISSNSTISVSTNLKVGDHIYLGDQNAFGIKRIHLNATNYISFQNALSFSSGGRLLWYEGQDGSSMAFRPAEASRDIFHLGTNYARWRDVYAVRGSIDTSDRNKKHDICPIDDKYKKLFMDLKPVSYKFNENKHNRIHTGFVSQDVEASLNKFGMDGLDFAGFCKEQAVTVTTDKDGGETMVPKVENGEPVYDYSLRYSEFISLNTVMIQDTIKSVRSLQDYMNNELFIASVHQEQGLQELAQKHKTEIQKLKVKLECEIKELKDKVKLLESQ